MDAENLLSQYGLPTLGAIFVSIACWGLVTFLKSLLVKEMTELKTNQREISKEVRSLMDDIQRIELMLRLSHDLKSGAGTFQPEMSRIGKAGTDTEL
tara:strand:- start:18650 stop:18940 length:291 start_codon:yes stop_codon:yes gene_type:complete